jgi:arylformamidase
MQQWLARVVNGRSLVTQLTHGTTDCYGNMPSRFQGGKPPRIAYTYDWPIWKAKAAWVFADDPDEPHHLEGFDYRRMSMWSAVSPEFLFVQRPPGATCGQVARANADTGAVQVLTSDEGEKDDPGLFISPEFGGEILLVCSVDNRELAVYRDLQAPDGCWTRLATLTLPAAAPYRYISSPETIAPATGVGGVSYFALLAREGKDRNTPGSIWVLGLGTDPDNRFARRVDDGGVTVRGRDRGLRLLQLLRPRHRAARTAPGKHRNREGEPVMRVCIWRMLAAGCLGIGVMVAFAQQQQMTLEQRFAQLDRDGDGQVTREEAGGAAWFDRLDANADGAITLDEARAALTAGRAPTTEAAPKAPDMQVHKGIAYAELAGADPNLLSLDLYAPVGAAGAPVAVWVHGGAWQKGDKAGAEHASFLSSFVREGYLVAALNYRLAPQAEFPAYPQDVAAGIAWVHEHAHEYGGDPARLVLIGHSAGAHLVALVATDETYLEEHGLALSDLAAVVPVDTEAYDLPHLAERFGGVLPDTWGVPFGQDRALWEAASPVAHIAPGKGIPPMLICYSGGMMDPQRRVNPHREPDARRFADALLQAQVRAEVIGAPEKSHLEIMQQFGLADDTIAPAVFAFLSSVLSGAAARPDATGFSPQDTPMGAPEFSYIDAEVLQPEGLMVFLDAELSAWVGELDPGTGLFRSPTGRDRLVDTGISRWSRYSNGPEWGRDREGAALFYVKDDANGRGQLWRAEPPWDQPCLTQLTHDQDRHNWVCAASLNALMPSIRIATYRGSPGATGNVDAWIDEDRPDQPHPFAQPMVVARWGPNTALITFAPKPRPDQTEPSQVTLVDTDSGVSRVITADAGHKIDPWLWQAPEYGGEVLLCVNVDGSALGIYRDTARDGGPWERIATLKLPPEAPHQRLKSVEPVSGGCGAFGQSYFTVQAGLDEDPGTSVWLFGLGPEGNHLVRRLNDGAVTGRPGRRLDPESFVGDEELFVYYTLVGDGASRVRRCETGITRGERR